VTGDGHQGISPSGISHSAFGSRLQAPAAPPLAPLAHMSPCQRVPSRLRRVLFNRASEPPGLLFVSLANRPTDQPVN